jgi:HEPN domain-containing protein
MSWAGHQEKVKFSMKDIEHARTLLAIAEKDLQALHLTKDTKIADSIFGFHAQQAVEKALKAWIAFNGIEYPRTHDISMLTAVLSDQGCDTEKFSGLITYNPFAVQLRYDAVEEPDEPLDREKVINDVKSILEFVRDVIKKAR